MASLYAAGEEDVIAYYLTHTNSNGDHDITHPKGKSWDSNEELFIIEGTYAAMRNDSQYIHKKAEDDISYLWDALIEAFTKHMLQGTTLVPDGETFVLSEREIAVRYMALERRLHRRSYGKAILDVLKNKSHLPRFFRGMIPDASQKEKTGFFFLTFAYPDGIAKNYELYRQGRTNMLYAYGMGLLDRNRHLERVIGIATEPDSRVTGRAGSSEDIILIEPKEWTSDFEQEAATLCEKFNIFQTPSLQVYPIHEEEYPA